MYQVPRNQPPSQGQGLKDSHDGRCPTCGSRRYIPADGQGVFNRNLPRAVQRFICTDCGTTYRIIEPLPTWSDLAQDATTYIVLLMLLAVTLALLL